MNSLFLQGLLHPLQAPTHIMLLAGLGLLLGQQGGCHLRWGALAFLLSLMLGLAFSKLAWGTDLALLFGSACTGALLALRLRLPCGLSALLAGMAGVLIGLASAPHLIPGLKALKIYTVMAGTLSSASLMLLFLALLGLVLRPWWEGVLLRVLGSWVVASTLMVTTLLLIKR